MKRKIYEKLLNWKERSQGRSTMLIDGARRVGKSYIAESFGSAEYRSYLLIDFSYPRPGLIKLFQEDYYNLDLFFSKLSALYGTLLFPRESLLIFDEVQLFPPARQLIKQLVKDGRYDYLETGSLVSLRKNVSEILIPSEEEHIEMFPMDFEEYLWAMGDESTIPFLRDIYTKRLPLGQHLHRKILNDFRTYMLVGEMPQAVACYAETRDFGKTDLIKKQILSLYWEDIGKFAGKDKQRVYDLFQNIPGQLSRKEKRYRLADIAQGNRSRSYEDAFSWLSKSMIVNLARNATDPTIGLSLSSDYTTQKCYMGDTGLLVTLAFQDDDYSDNSLYRAILLDRLNVNEGMLMENIVAQML